ncbi:MAG: putative Ig domain-containing protein [Verrucomicrobiae bacterium]|nr:putative Ig domain-containing protein [Verrucomicrobiae bacterium]
MLLTFVGLAPRLEAQGIAYGSLTNFDTVNDTNHECHGFEIELEDCHSTDITRTYNYNHYGVPEIIEDDSDPAHPVCRIFWKSRKNVDGSWAAYTAIPEGPINPTNGHQFTNPNVNFGGEHFGVSYRTPPSVVRYFWLIDGGSGNLVRGGQVQVAVPSFNYFPPAGAAPARVQAAIQPPEPPEIPVVEFGTPMWVKEIRTTTHNNHDIHLRDLVSDDPDDDHDRNWRNGEPDEIEVEWQLLQVEFAADDGGGMGELVGEAEDLNDGDEVVTRRWEFFEYVGPVDNESKEAKADKVGPDDLHGEGVKQINGVNIDLSTVVVVGEYKGAQMAAVGAEAELSLVDHVGDGVLNQAYAGRALVISGSGLFTSTVEGDLPTGMSFDEITGILEGTPTETGQFTFKVTAMDGVSQDVEKNYTFSVHPPGAEPPPVSLVDTASSPAGSGTTSGDGAFAPGTEVTVSAAPKPGFAFVNWSDNGEVVSATASHTLTLDVNHSLVAAFEPVAVGQFTVSLGAQPAAGGTVSGSGVFDGASDVTVTATANAGHRFVNWTEGGAEVSTSATYVFTISTDRDLVANFEIVPTVAISVAAAPLVGGSVSGGGDVEEGSLASVSATANAGYTFENWTENGVEVSTSANYSFDATANRSLVANFLLVSGPVTPTPAREYGVADLSTMTPAQLAALPHFDHYVPQDPPGAPSDFLRVAHNGRGLVIGNRNYGTSWVQGNGAYVQGGVSTNITAWLREGYSWSFSWSNLQWDGTDYHFSNGFITHSPVRDVNIDGMIVGYATIPGAASQNTSNFPSSEYRDHAWLVDATVGAKIDLTPAARRADPRMINDLGEIIGNWSNENESHAFRRAPDGSFTDFTLNAPTTYGLSPMALNNHGHVAGNATVYTVPDRDYRPFISEIGGATEHLPLPSQGSPDTGKILDMSDHDVIVGYGYKVANITEPSGVRWTRNGGGNWVAEDLNEILNNNDFIIDRCLAVNDAGYIIASGHPDGSDSLNTATLLLTPDEFPPPAAVTLKATDVTSTSAIIRAKINACTNSTTAEFQYGDSSGYGETESVPGVISGTNPEVVTLALTGLEPGTTYHFRVRASNASGDSTGQDMSFTTPGAGVQHIVNVSATPAEGGTVSGGGAFDTDANVTVTATPNPGFVFVNWTEGGVEVGVTSSLSLSVTADRSLVSNFAPVPTFSIVANPAPAEGGSVAGGGDHPENASVMLTATTNPGYRFLNWTEGGVEVSTSSAYTFTATAERALLANFELIPSYSITATSIPAAGGVVSGSDNFLEGANVSLTATPSEGYTFVNWTENGTEIGTSIVLSFTADSARNLVANFREEQPSVVFDPAAAGTFAGLILDGTSGSPVGSVNLRLSGRQGFTGLLTHTGLGLRLRLRGQLAEDGSFTGEFVRGGVTYAVSLQLVATDGGQGAYRIEGSFTENGNVHLLSLDRSGFRPRTNPAPWAGRYTSLFPADPLGAGPGGDGYGLITVSSGGAVRMVGMLGDFTRFSHRGFVSEDGEWRVFISLYRARPQGCLGGVVTFRDLPGVSDFDGVLAWDRPAMARARFYPDGFHVDTNFVGSVFTPPARGEAVLAEFDLLKAPNALWRIGGGDLTDPGPVDLNWMANDRVGPQVAAPDRMRVQVNRRSGYVSGFYLNRATRERINFRGVAFQKQGIIEGLFPGQSEVGAFSIEPQ